MTEAQYQRAVNSYVFYMRYGYMTIADVPWMYRWDVAQILGIPGDDFLYLP